MRILGRWRRESATSLDTVKEIQERVREMRRRLGDRDADLSELFALVKEDERPILREVESRQVRLERPRQDQGLSKKSGQAGPA